VFLLFLNLHERLLIEIIATVAKRSVGSSTAAAPRSGSRGPTSALTLVQVSPITACLFLLFCELMTLSLIVPSNGAKPTISTCRDNYSQQQWNYYKNTYIELQNRGRRFIQA
jgi:hypothetical protein